MGKHKFMRERNTTIQRQFNTIPILPSPALPLEHFKSVGKENFGSSLGECGVYACAVLQGKFMPWVFSLRLGAGKPSGLFSCLCCLCSRSGWQVTVKRQRDRALLPERHICCGAELEIINKPLTGASLKLFFF